MKRTVVEIRTGVGDHVVVSRDRRVDYCEACDDYELNIRESQELTLKAAIVVLRDQTARHTPGLFKRVRKILGMTQAELAHKFGVRQETVSRWEQGQDEIQVCTWGALEYANSDGTGKDYRWPAMQGGLQAPLAAHVSSLEIVCPWAR